MIRACCSAVLFDLDGVLIDCGAVWNERHCGPTRTLPERGRVSVAIQWRNWCGSPRGAVRASVALTIAGVAPRLNLGVVTAPTCVEARFSCTGRQAGRPAAPQHDEA
jgi:hypothetical protein